MKMLVRLFLIALGLALLFGLAFIIWGPALESTFSADACAAWFDESRPWAWIIAIALLIGDLILPIPASGVIAALGAVYGPILGGLIGTLGSVLAGLMGYGLARLAGERLSRWLASPEERAECQALFDRWGGLVIILSRMLPILPEVFSVMAGLARMRFEHFFLALVLGSAAMAFLFAGLGAVAKEAPSFGLPLVLGVPALLWVAIVIIRQRAKNS